ncbi:hypothetical protein D1BOALGB6SA_353 [Olavius sp. associated proteobacterium Delta 1]|nr:hypothetical protein D1BOALGB6SA_353 [Olavius sp. associated proteobacterium Delta 1]
MQDSGVKTIDDPALRAPKMVALSLAINSNNGILKLGQVLIDVDRCLITYGNIPCRSTYYLNFKAKIIAQTQLR